ncbi:MAG: DUF5811 family protein [Haloarculaceae archaeon]
MHGNTPYAGRPGGEPSEESLTPDQRRALRRDLAALAARTRELLPDEFAVGSEITQGANGPQAMVAVQPPVGRPVSAGFSPEETSVADREALVHELAAGAAFQVKQALDDVSPTAR